MSRSVVTPRSVGVAEPVTEEGFKLSGEDYSDAMDAAVFDRT